MPIREADRSLIFLLDAQANASSLIFTLRHTTSATPAAGFGSRVKVELQSLGGLHDASYIDFILTDVTDLSEDVDLVISLMAAGLDPAEKARLTSVGDWNLIGHIQIATGMALYLDGATRSAYINISAAGMN
ncbi:hypothetical protein KKF45_05140, partial [Patescibacteria group bacterium]|nr:hypothetical protein [Patescibacteria group bacterium]